MQKYSKKHNFLPLSKLLTMNVPKLNLGKLKKMGKVPNVANEMPFYAKTSAALKENSSFKSLQSPWTLLCIFCRLVFSTKLWDKRWKMLIETRLLGPPRQQWKSAMSTCAPKFLSMDQEWWNVCLESKNAFSVREKNLFFRLCCAFFLRWPPPKLL